MVRGENALLAQSLQRRLKRVRGRLLGRLLGFRFRGCDDLRRLKARSRGFAQHVLAQARERREGRRIRRELPVDLLHFLILTPLPGSADYRRLLDEFREVTR